MTTLHGVEVLDVPYGDRVLHYNPLSHEYHLDSMPLKSTTQYLKDAGYCRLWNGNGDAATIGRYKHEATALDDLGDLDMDTLDPKLVAAVELWRQFKREYDFVPDLDLMERPCFHPTYLYAGTPDVPGFLRGTPCVIEKKFGAKERWHHLQVGGAYTPMLASHYPRYKGAESYLVYMSDGANKPDVVPVNDKRLPGLFLSIVATVNGRGLYGPNGRA